MAIGSKSLLESRLLNFGDEGDDDDPRTGLVNLADVMLVFACGLIVALVARYNVDLTDYQPDDMEHVTQQVTQAQEEISVSSARYSEMGTIYQDTETGELYMVRNADATDVNEED